MKTTVPTIPHRLRLALLTLGLGLASCFGSDTEVGVRINVLDDLSGTIHTRSLVASEVEGRMTTGSGGVKWEHHAQVVFGRGDFESINEVKLDEIHFDVSKSESGISVMTVTLPRGPQVKWPATLTSKVPRDRLETGGTLEPGSSKSFGDRVEISIEFPTPVISQGIRFRARGLDGEKERNTAKLSVTADAAQVEGDDLVWVITW
ncbi:MAG: hypothetical protein ACI835_003052 [Planctomycetota bacterium]|jgi:hypothetical protein